MKLRYVNAPFLLGASLGLLFAAGNLAAQTSEHDHEEHTHTYTCGSDWARSIDQTAVNEATRLNNPEVYARMMARAKAGNPGRAVLSAVSAAEELTWEFFLVNRGTGQRESVTAVSKYITDLGPDHPKTIIWVDIRDTASNRVRQSTIDRLAEGLDQKVKPGPNTRDPNKGVVENDIEIFGEPPVDKFTDGEIKIHILLLDIDNGDLTGGTLSGYFSPLDQTEQIGSNQMNILYVDSPPLYGANPSVENVLGTVAHEFQHLINHRHYTGAGNDAETHWLYNEGLSEVASLRNGYSDRNASGFLDAPNYFAYFDAPFGATRGDTILPAYARGMMMCHYLSEQFGDGFLNNLVKAPGTHLEPITWAMQQTGVNDLTAKDVFTNFWVANYLQNSNNPQGNSRWKYNYAVAGRATSSVLKAFPSAPRTDEQIVKGYASYVQRYGNSDVAGTGLKVKFLPNSREYRVHAVLFRNSSEVVDVRPLEIDQEYNLENFSLAVFVINSLSGDDQNVQWVVEGTTLGVEDYASSAGALAVTGAVPNPAREEVRFGFRTAQGGSVTLELFDVRGEAVARPLDGARYEAGEHSVAIDVAGLQAGVYTARLQDASGAVAVRQIVVLK